MAVSFTELVKPHLAVLRFDYNGATAFLLIHLRRNKFSRHKGEKDECGKDHQVHDSLEHRGAARPQRKHAD